MIHKKKISKSEQQKWFAQINTPNNFYFIIEYEERYIGLINGKDADFESKTMEGGIFIWDAQLWKTHIPVVASIIMNDCNFYISRFQTLVAKVLKCNNQAIQYNLNLGYQIAKEIDDVYIMHLTQSNYEQKISKLRKGIAVLYKDNDLLSYQDIVLDNDKDVIRLLYNNLPKDLKSVVDLIVKNSKIE